MTSDKWLIVKTQGGVYKLFASWSGSYLGSDHWRFSTHINEVEDKGDYFTFVTASGSVYDCNKNFYGIAGAYNEATYAQLIKSKGIEEMPENTDWVKLIYKEDE